MAGRPAGVSLLTMHCTEPPYIMQPAYAHVHALSLPNVSNPRESRTEKENKRERERETGR